MKNTDLPTTDDFQFRHVATNGIRLHVAEKGVGPTVLLLHGFPEFWYSWRHQLRHLATAGYRALAPDLRGYNDSDRPRGVSAYRTKELVADVVGLLRHAGNPPAVVVGHDWGGIIAWRVASLHPELVRGLVILNAPHPTAFRSQLLRNPLQLVKSYYTLLFQLPALPEKVLAAKDFAIPAGALRRQPQHRDAFSPGDIALYKRAWRKSGLRGPVNYYRAALRHPSDLFASPQRVEVPACLVWGVRDPYLTMSLAPRSARWATHATVHLLPDASHWVQNDAPDEVNSRLLDFLRRLAPGGGDH